MGSELLSSWLKPVIDAECSRAHSRYSAQLVTHYTSYFEAHPELKGTHSYSAKDLASTLPSGAAELEAFLPKAKCHRHFRSGKSSQTLALGILGTAYLQDRSLGWLTEMIGTDIGELQRDPVFEFDVAPSLLNESPRVTSVDFFVQTSKFLVCLESKWSERGMGACSCAQEDDDDATLGDADEDDGEPVVAECSKRVLERPKYWETAATTFGLPERCSGTYCPISTPYQAIRNVAAARALAEGRQAVFILAFDDQNPYFKGCGEWPGWPAVLKSSLPDSGPCLFRSWSWQQLVQQLPMNESARAWAREKHRLPA